MKETLIIFKTEMVRAIIEGRKTQTRRFIKPQPAKSPYWTQYYDNGVFYPPTYDAIPPALKCPYGKKGDLLWVREAFWPRPYKISYRDMLEGADTWPELIYDADESDVGKEQLKEWGWKKKPSIHMPKKYCRIWLEITNVRVERLQDISDDDCISEGIKQRWTCINPSVGSYAHENDVFDDYRQLWDSINGKKHPWTSNPFVWVIESKPIPPKNADTVD